MIDALLYLGELLPPDYCYAVPLNIPHHRFVEAIVDEIEQVYPSVKEQHFRALALDVLNYKWPCHYVSPIAAIARVLFGGVDRVRKCLLFG